jgi:hypothetical protein
MGRLPEAAGPAINTAASTSPVIPPTVPPGESTALESPTAGESPDRQPARKGLWGVMQNVPSVKDQSAIPELAVAESPALPVPRTPPVEPPVARPNDPELGVEAHAVPQDESNLALQAILGMSTQESLAATSEKTVRVRVSSSRRAVWSLGLGLASIPIASIALFNTVWSRLPAPLVGFLAILTGLIATQEIRHSGGRKMGRKYATYGIIAGIVGSFLGPVVMSGLGRNLMHSWHQRFTTVHLKTIGAALTEYEKQRGSFPPGGVFRRNKAGDLRGYHGWLTMLLPWVGEADLYAAVRQNLPYDDKANLPVFEQDVPTFFASGTDQSKVRGRFGVSHFAGVGGEISDDRADGERVLHVGLFGVNSSVTRDDVTDGLANTLAAGEIADDLPAWGDPENWRTIGRGLNRDRQGFGNHDRTGACFLMADGSVRFLSNRTDLRVLAALSTRDGGEP